MVEYNRRTSSWDAQRSRRIFQVAQYNWILIPLLLAIAYPITYRLLDNPETSYFHIPVDDSTSWNWGAFIWLVMVLPSKPFHHFSMLAACWPCNPFRLTETPTIRNFSRLLICLVTRGDQEDVVRRSVLAMQDMISTFGPKVSLHILTEEANSYKFRRTFDEHVPVHGVPASHKCRLAKYKARSLEWFRIHMRLQDDDWVLHIDEETVIDEYCIEKCFDFITKQNSNEIGTGVIHYNLEGFWNCILPTIGDLSRVQDDWGRCQWSANYRQRASLGIHGAFFLCSGKVENAVTWETAHLTEDYWFLLRAMKQNFRIGWIPAIAREVSPRSVGDYVRQRRRWYTGIRTLGQLEGKWVLFCWLWGFVDLAYLLWRFAAGSSPEPVPRWLLCVIVFELSCFRLFTALIVFVQDWDAAVSWSSMMYSQVMAQLLRPYVDLLDSYAVVLSLLVPEKGFYIVQKK
ncbi:glycosyltransferase family 2 protein [Zasmidium cellare ATCC 36951]|uniref:Glycosyltransferase family 2 protein n=1 Tax=Zasmidium cellare ATCC 36951 TaxID=1080233 RepID=A0A6A6CEW7_ZASCE|nr:glycosyltransferase family 2 protein [Zasmidium cellare ATCC 36951]KAF2164708.1 glycosyltransferase family 2 protein [Zasmidium cellare ATCC 36951]